MTALTTTGGAALPSLTDMAGALARASNDLGVQAGGDVNYIKYVKGGWSAHGLNGEDEIIEEDEWVLNPYSIIHGYISFGDQKEYNTFVNSAFEPKPALASLPEPLSKTVKKKKVPGSWDTLIGVGMTGLGGDLDGQTFTYKTTSQGGRQMMQSYINLVVAKAQAGDKKVVARVTLGTESYDHDEFGTVHKPVLIFKGWTTMEESDIRGSAEEADEQTAEAAAPEDQPDLPEVEQAPEESIEPEPKPEGLRKRRRRAA